jgi:hypothetical protein
MIRALLGSRFLFFYGHQLLGGFYLLSSAKHEAADNDEDQKRNEPESYPQT